MRARRRGVTSGESGQCDVRCLLGTVEAAAAWGTPRGDSCDRAQAGDPPQRACHEGGEIHGNTRTVVEREGLVAVEAGGGRVSRVVDRRGPVCETRCSTGDGRRPALDGVFARTVMFWDRRGFGMCAVRLATEGGRRRRRRRRCTPPRNGNVQVHACAGAPAAAARRKAECRARDGGPGHQTEEGTHAMLHGRGSKWTPPFLLPEGACGRGVRASRLRRISRGRVQHGVWREGGWAGSVNMARADVGVLVS
ncbi:hypothetical protein C2E23DRAFT_580190 [Lenzites betulinus]|nr:hypothetical protein C2E23DRAFT_580190 [Lenzites betulinus]